MNLMFIEIFGIPMYYTMKFTITPNIERVVCISTESILIVMCQSLKEYEKEKNSWSYEETSERIKWNWNHSNNVDVNHIAVIKLLQ